jgi:outer membrane protein TolC
LEVYDAAKRLVDENLRVNERLFEHDKVTEDAVFRARTEMLAVVQTQRDAQNDRDLAKSYFNFLLNRSFEEDIDALSNEAMLASTDRQPARWLPAVSGQLPADPSEALSERALENRYELKQLEAAMHAAQSAVDLSKSSLLPGVSLALDLGLQGTTYGFAEDHSFYMASIVLDWKLFRGGQNRSRLQQARLDAQRLHTQHDELQRQIALQVQEATDNLEAARESLRTARERLRSSREGYRLTSRKYEEGMSNQVAFLDVRTTFTEAEINFNITYYDVLIRLAELEYAAAVDRPPAP